MCVPDRRVFFVFHRFKNALEFSTNLREEPVFYHPKVVELMLLIPIMLMDNAHPLMRFIGKEDHFNNLLFHDMYLYAKNVGVGSSLRVGILHD